MRVAHLDPLSGASGDMLLGAALDAGADLDAVVQILQGLGLEGWALRADRVLRRGVPATSVVMLVADTDSAIVRTWGNVRGLLEDADLPVRVKARSLATFSRLAQVEARLSRREIAHVHFSEIGALDAIIDVVSVCAGFDLLRLDAVTCGPVAVGLGMARGEHGLHPVPSPAVLALLEGATTFSTGEPTELCTPTGAALLAEWADAWTPMPPLTLRQVGYGAGTRDLALPNVLRLVVGERADQEQGPAEALLLSALTDGHGEQQMAGTLRALRRAGAADAWSRAAGQGRAEVTCLTDLAQAEQVRRAMAQETGTAQVLAHAVQRWSSTAR